MCQKQYMSFVARHGRVDAFKFSYDVPQEYIVQS